MLCSKLHCQKDFNLNLCSITKSYLPQFPECMMAERAGYQQPVVVDARHPLSACAQPPKFEIHAQGGRG